VVQILLGTMVVSTTKSVASRRRGPAVLGKYQRLPAEQFCVRAVDLRVRT